MMKQTQNYSQKGINPDDIKPKALDLPSLPYTDIGKTTIPLDKSQIRQKIKVGSFTITSTGIKYLNIGYIPSLIEIKAFDSGHSAYSEAIITPWENHCIYKDSWWNYSEATTNTVIYISHAGITSASISSFWQLFKINCTSYTHDAIIHWIAHP